LIGCEESQKVTQAFRKRGHECFSLDLVATRGNPEWHIQGDVHGHLLSVPDEYYDLGIFHIDCTKVALSGNRWYGKGMPRHNERLLYIKWTQIFWDTAKKKCKRLALENPASVIFRHIDYDALQYIQPWQFGHGEKKKTGLALIGLPKLIPTNIVEGREERIWKMAPSKTRKRDRSETYQGIADAMAQQWGCYELS
jgi:hypothetical protein